MARRDFASNTINVNANATLAGRHSKWFRKSQQRGNADGNRYLHWDSYVDQRSVSGARGGIGTINLNGNVGFNSANLNMVGVAGSGHLSGALSTIWRPHLTGTPTLDFGAAPGTVNVSRLLGFGAGTYTLLSNYSFVNAANLPAAPLPGVTMSTPGFRQYIVVECDEGVAPAASRVTWTGSNGTNHNWSTPANWGGTNIAVGGPCELYFPPAPANNDYISTDDIATLTIHSIVVDSSTPYTIGGTVTSLTVDGNGTNVGTAISVMSGSGHIIGTSPLIWSTSDQVVSAIGSFTLSSNITNGAFNTYFNNTSDMTYSGILGAGAGGLLKTGPGKLTLTGASSYTGINTLLAGTVSVSTPANLGGSAAANSILFPAGDTAILQLTGAFASTLKGITLNGNGIIDVPRLPIRLPSRPRA